MFGMFVCLYEGSSKGKTKTQNQQPSVRRSETTTAVVAQLLHNKNAKRREEKKMKKEKVLLVQLGNFRPTRSKG